MQNNWFYIQQWKTRRWSYIGKELNIDDAKYLFKRLCDDMDNYNNVQPIACVTKDDKYKITLEPESGWNIVMCNAMFVMDDKDDDGLLVQCAAK